MEWERARSKEQKEHRISEIVNATARLYEKYSFEEISFVLIAKEAKFARSNLYNYFNSKEEIFLEFLKHDIILFRRDLVESYQPSKVYLVEEFSSVWVKIQVKHKRLLKLLSILHIFLEKNVSIERLIDFKMSVKDELKNLSELLCRLFPLLTSEKATKFLNLQLTVAIGLYQMTNLSDIQQEVLEYPEFVDLKIDFSSYFQDAVEYLLKGLLD